MVQNLYILFCCLLVLQGVPSFGTVSCTSLLSTTAPEDFSIRFEDVALNPTERLVWMNGQSTKLGQTEYLVMELLVLAEGAVVPFEDFQEEALREANALKREAPEYKRTWLAQYTFRLRRKLKEVFGQEISDRILNISGRGLAWNSPKLIEKSKSFDPGKITYIYNQHRVFVGEKEIILSPQLWTIFSSFVHQRKTQVSVTELGNAWWILTREEVNEDWFRVYLSRLNSTFSKEFKSGPRKVFSFLSEGKRWKMNAELVDVLENLP